MEWKILLTIFSTVLLAELGDKTQLATMLFATDKAVSKWLVFGGASAALVVATAIGVLGGQWVSTYINPKMLSLIAGVGFIAIGGWTVARALQ